MATLSHSNLTRTGPEPNWTKYTGTIPYQFNMGLFGWFGISDHFPRPNRIDSWPVWFGMPWIGRYEMIRKILVQHVLNYPVWDGSVNLGPKWTTNKQVQIIWAIRCDILPLNYLLKKLVWFRARFTKLSPSSKHTKSNQMVLFLARNGLSIYHCHYHEIVYRFRSSFKTLAQLD